MTMPSDQVDLSTQPKRPDASLGELFSEMTTELSTLLRQEVELAKTEAREEAGKAGKAAALFAVGAVAALLALTFLSAGLAWLLDNVMGSSLAFALVGVLWLIVGVIVISIGRRRFAAVGALPETTRSIKEDVAWAKAQKS